MTKKYIVIQIILALHTCAMHAEDNFIQRCNLKLIDIIMVDVFSPPVASRIHLYTNIAAYEVMARGDKNYRSLYTQIKHLPELTEKSAPPIHYPLAAEVAFLFTAKHFIYSEDKMEEFLQSEISDWQKTIRDTALIQRSIAYGKKAAQRMIEWSKKDHYAYTRTLRRYDLSDSLGAWQQTPPEYMNALEPNWRLIRKIVFDSAEFIAARPNLKYEESKESPFYKNAFSVYQAVNTLTPEQRAIALYWDDNPLTTKANGHLSYTVKKPTPGGHWLKITTQLIGEKKLNSMKSAEIYMLVSISMFEGFIHCWNTKYATNSIRPETYIQRLIDKNWKPLIETPPFPEYTSGHSVVSGCISSTLSHFFETSHSFTDSSQLPLELGTRKFQSLKAAAEEASMSRFYGGIHFKPALDFGLEQGRKISHQILTRIQTRKKK